MTQDSGYFIVRHGRAYRQAPHYRRKQREPINWGRCLMVAGATFLTLATLLYKFGTP